MKKVWKKLLTIAVSVSMAFSLCAPALASGAAVDPALLAGGIELTEDAAVTEDQTRPTIIAAAGITVSIRDARLVGLIVAPGADGAKITVSGASTVPILVVLAPKAEIIFEAEAAIGVVTVVTPGVTVSAAGSVAGIVMAESAAGSSLAIAESARVEAVTVYAAGLTLDVAAGAVVGAVTAPESVRESLRITGEGAEKVQVTKAPSASGPEEAGETEKDESPNVTLPAQTEEPAASEPEGTTSNSEEAKEPEAGSPEDTKEPETGGSEEATDPEESGGKDTEGSLNIGKIEEKKQSPGNLVITYDVSADGLVTNYYIKWQLNSAEDTSAPASSGVIRAAGAEESAPAFEFRSGNAVTINDEGQELAYGKYTLIFSLVEILGDGSSSEAAAATDKVTFRYEDGGKINVSDEDGIPTESGTEPTESTEESETPGSVQPVGPSGETPTEDAEASTDAGEGTDKPEEESTAPTDGPGNSSEEVTEPSKDPEGPAGEPEGPAGDSKGPSGETEESSEDSKEPTEEPKEPTKEPQEPAGDLKEPPNPTDGPTEESDGVVSKPNEGSTKPPTDPEGPSED